MENWRLVAPIGKGGMGRVFKAVSTHPQHANKQYALKKVEVTSLKQLNFALREISVVLQFNHKRIVKCYEFFIDRYARDSLTSIILTETPPPMIKATSKSNEKKGGGGGLGFKKMIGKSQDDIVLGPKTAAAKRRNSDEILLSSKENSLLSLDHFSKNEAWFVCIVFELCSHGSLKDRIEKQKQHSNKRLITEEHLWKWFRQILEGLAYMHNKNVLHRDMKPENCFLDSQDDIKIGDLGLARILLDETHAETVGGTIQFLAPELKSSSPKYDSKLDIWGLGCIAVELASLIRCDYAFAMSDPSELRQIFTAVRLHFSERVLDFIKATLVLNPKDRPSAKQLLVEFFNFSPLPNPTIGPMTPSPINYNIVTSSIFDSASSIQSIKSCSQDQAILVSRRIPDEIYVVIFSYLTQYDISVVGQVCSRWKDILDYNIEGIWNTMFQTCWRTDVTRSLADEIERDFGSLQDAFIYRTKLEKNWQIGRYKYTHFSLHGGSAVNRVAFFMGSHVNTQYLKHIYRFHKQRRRNMINKGNRSVGSSNKNMDFVDEFKFDDDYGLHALTLTCSEDGTLKVFDICGIGLRDAQTPIKKELICTFAGHQRGVSCFDFNYNFDQRVMISGSSDKSIILWDILSGDPINRINCQSEVIDITLLNSTTFGSAGHNQVDLWDLTSSKEIKSYTDCHQGAVHAIAHDRRGIFTSCFATGGFDGAVKIWDMRQDSNSGAVFSDQDVNNSVNELFFYGNQLISGHGSGVVEMYDIRKLDHKATAENRKKFSLNLGSSGAIRGLFCDGVKIVSGSSSGAIKLMDSSSGKFINHIMHNAQQLFKTSQLTSLDCNATVLMSSDLGGVVSIFDFTNTGTTVEADDYHITDRVDTTAILPGRKDGSCIVA